MHCRIGCRLNGGFIECLDDQATILINGRPRNRARLSDGDRVRIGTVDISVDIPQQAKQQAFEIAFDDEDEIVATHVSDGQPNATPVVKDGIRNDKTDQTRREIESENAAESEARTPMVAPVEIAETKPEETKSDQSKKPVFEFDSVDATDTDVTSDDLEAIENMNGNSLVMQDFAFSAEEAFPDHVREESEQDSSEDNSSQVPSSDDSENTLDGGSSQGGKCWRWGGRRVSPVIETLQRKRHDLNFFRVEQNVNLSSCSFEKVMQAVSDREEVSIYLLSSHGKDEVLRQLFSKRWNERLTHPEALSVSLSLLPARNIVSLFEHIDAAILIQGRDVELVRLNNQL